MAIKKPAMGAVNTNAITVPAALFFLYIHGDIEDTGPMHDPHVLFWV